MSNRFGRRTGLSIAAIAAVAGLAGMNNIPLGSGGTVANEARQAGADRTNLSLRNMYSPSSLAGLFSGGYGNWKSPRYPNGPGWTCAHVKRMARKTKNRAKHRARVNAKGGKR